MTDLAATFRKPFAEQVAAFRLRLANLVPTSRWDDISHGQHDRAFMVAGALKADLLADLAGAVDKAIAQGTTLEQFQRDFRAIVEKNGWHGWTGEGTAKGEAWRTRVIYRTNLATSYAAGRRAQLIEGNFKYWVYRHGGSLEPRLQHLAWDGIALPPDHPFWATHYPPNGWGCSCGAVGTNSEAGIKRVGGVPGKELPPGWDRIDPRTGAPAGIDKGWGYAPGATVAEDVLAAVARKADALPDAIASDLTAAIDTVGDANDLARLRAIIDDSMPGVSADILERSNLAIEPLLTVLEKAAIHAYTQPGFYGRLNEYLRAKAAGGPVNADFDFVTELLNRSLRKLPPAAGTSFRGVDVSSALLQRFNALKAGDVVDFAGLTSTSRTAGAALNGEVLLEIRGAAGRSIRHLALIQAEDEVLFTSGSRFRVVSSSVDTSKGYDILHIIIDEFSDTVAEGLIIARMSENAVG